MTHGTNESMDYLYLAEKIFDQVKTEIMITGRLSVSTAARAADNLFTITDEESEEVLA